MTSKEFFKKIIKLYQKARESKFPDSNIFRGRNSSISSDLEDLMALFLVKNDKKKCLYYTDQAIRVPGTKNNKYPDIVIFNKDNTTSHLIDVKADIGWNRNGMVSFCKGWDQLIEKWKGKDFSLKKGTTKEKISGCFNKKLKYHIVIISLVNSGKQILEDQKTISKFKNIELYILSDGEHPNEYKTTKEILEKMNIKDEEFKRLLKNIK